VEESHLKNADLALMNFENSYNVSKDYLGEEDLLTQKVKA
jgi:hypothetical protein